MPSYTVISLRFSKWSKSDSSLFIFSHGSDSIYLLLYVDDIILAVSDLGSRFSFLVLLPLKAPPIYFYLKFPLLGSSLFMMTWILEILVASLRILGPSSHLRVLWSLSTLSTIGWPVFCNIWSSPCMILLVLFSRYVSIYMTIVNLTFSLLSVLCVIFGVLFRMDLTFFPLLLIV